MANHPDHLRAAGEMAAAFARIREVRAARIPDIRAEAGVKHLAEVSGTGFTASLSLPLPLWNRQGANLTAAELELHAAEIDEHSTALRLEQQLQQNLEQMRLSVETYSTLRTRVRPIAVEAAQSIETGYRAGRLTYLDLLEGQRSLLETEDALLDAAAESWRIRARLEVLLGTSLDSLPPSTEEH